jgi:predicted amidohydrolase YtcJ
LTDLIVKAGRIYAMDERRATFRSLAVRDGWILEPALTFVGGRGSQDRQRRMG